MDILAEITKDLEPVKPSSKNKLAAAWLGWSIFFAGFFLWIVGLRYDLSEKFLSVPYTAAFVFLRSYIFYIVNLRDFKFHPWRQSTKP